MGADVKRTGKLTALPGAGIPAYLDLSTVVCVRVQPDDNESFVVVHTSEGFGVGVSPVEGQTLEQLVAEIVKLVEEGR
jgi:hypothetical protein